MKKSQQILPGILFAAGLFAVLAFFFLGGALCAEEEPVLFFDEEPTAEAVTTDTPAVPAETQTEPVETETPEPAPETEPATVETAETADTEASAGKTTGSAEEEILLTEDGQAEDDAETVTAEKPVPKPEIEAAIRQLAAGNARYLGQNTEAASDITRPEATDDSFPLASIFYASDISPDVDVLLDLPKKTLYTVPVRAGVFTAEELDDLEYGVVNLQTPVAVVMTQYPSDDALYVLRNFDRLEAVAKKDAAELDNDPNLSVQNDKPADNDLYLYSLLGPSVARAKKAYPEMSEADLANVIAETAAWQSLETVLMQSDAVRRLISSGELSLIAAMVEKTSGQIYWLGTHPLQDEFLKAPPQQVVEKKQKEELAAVKASNASEDGVTTEEFLLEEEPLEADELPEPLTEETVTFYQNAWTPATSCCGVVTEYYTAYRPFIPRWRVFYPSIWYYRPWYGAYLPYYIPYPYYDPWWYSGWGAYYPWRAHRWGCYIGCGVGFGFAFYVGTGFHPYDPWWDRPWCHTPIDHPRWHGGPRGDIWYSGGPGWHAGGESWRHPRPHQPPRPDGPRPNPGDGPGDRPRPHDGPHHGPDGPGDRPRPNERPDATHRAHSEPERGPRPSGNWRPGDVGRTIGERGKPGEILSGEDQRGGQPGHRSEDRLDRRTGNRLGERPERRPGGPGSADAPENRDAPVAGDGEKPDRGARSVSGRGGRGPRGERARHGESAPGEAPAAESGDRQAERDGTSPAGNETRPPFRSRQDAERPADVNTPNIGEEKTPSPNGDGGRSRGDRNSRNRRAEPAGHGASTPIVGGEASQTITTDEPSPTGRPARPQNRSGRSNTNRMNRGSSRPGNVGSENNPAIGGIEAPAAGSEAPSVRDVQPQTRPGQSTANRQNRNNSRSSRVGGEKTPAIGGSTQVIGGDSPSVIGRGQSQTRSGQNNMNRPNRSNNLPGNIGAERTPAPSGSGISSPGRGIGPSSGNIGGGANVRPERNARPSRSGRNGGDVIAVPRANTPSVTTGTGLPSRMTPPERPSRMQSGIGERPSRVPSGISERPSRGVSPAGRPSGGPAPAGGAPQTISVQRPAPSGGPHMSSPRPSTGGGSRHSGGGFSGGGRAGGAPSGGGHGGGHGGPRR